MWEGELQHHDLRFETPASVHFDVAAIDAFLNLGHARCAGRHFSVTALASGAFGGPQDESWAWAFGGRAGTGKWIELDLIAPRTYGRSSQSHQPNLALPGRKLPATLPKRLCSLHMLSPPAPLPAPRLTPAANGAWRASFACVRTRGAKRRTPWRLRSCCRGISTVPPQSARPRRPLRLPPPLPPLPPRRRTGRKACTRAASPS